MKIKTMSHLIQANKRIGHHWFEADTMAFFNSQILELLYGDKYFVSSEKCSVVGSKRLYTIRTYTQTGEVSTAGEFQKYETENQAIKEIHRILAT